MSNWIDFPELSRETLRDLKTGIDAAFRGFSRQYGDLIESAFSPLTQLMTWIENLLTLTPWPITLACFAVLTYWITRNIRLSAATVAYLVSIGLLGMWTATMYTISLVLVGTVISIAIGIPVGIMLAKYDRALHIVNPLLDVMQTIPIFVYLIPVVMLLGLGKVPGLIAMCIYSVPPIIRLTNLGIRQVDDGQRDAAFSLGMTRFQTLHRIELPLARHSILTGMNQTVMMAISMVVIASMIGVQGLGTAVLQAVQNQYIGSGLISGSAIVGLAIIMDRIIQHAR